MCDQASRNGSITHIEIAHEEMRGEGARVTAVITYKVGSTTHEDQPLIEENGIWRITM
jgi:hypothetical protein